MYFIRFGGEFVGRSQSFSREEVLLGKAEADAFETPEAAQEAIDGETYRFLTGSLGNEFDRTMRMLFHRQKSRCDVVHVSPRITAIKRDRR